MGVKKPRHKKRIQSPPAFSPRHKQVADEYLANGFNKTQAMRACGYSDKSSLQRHAIVFKNPHVIAYLEEKKAKLKQKYELSEEWVISRLMKIADSNNILAPYKKVGADGELYWDFTDATQEELSVITGLMTETYTEGRDEGRRFVKKFKIEIADPKAALDSLARRLGLFNDKITVQGEVSFVERLQRGRERARLKKEEERE